jgi:hypothetical protein
MNKPFKNAVLFVLFVFPSTFIFSQKIQLGILSSFEAYTGTGAVSNSGKFTGDVGSDNGEMTGFTPPNFTGNIYHNDAVTEEARIDLVRLYIHLSDIFVTHPGTHAAAFGSGETLLPGVYSIGGAASLAGSLTLDGDGNPDAVFIIKIVGAMTVGVDSKIFLTNGTRAANVFWIAEGAISVGAGSIIKGTLIAHPGAISLGVNVNVEGRILSTEGALNIASACEVKPPVGPINIPIDCINGCNTDPARIVDVFGSVKGFGLYTSLGAVVNAASSGFIGDIGTNAGAISGFGTSVVIGDFYHANAITAKAKIDLDIAYIDLMAIPNTKLSHSPAFGLGELLYPGVYYIGAAGSLAGTITLDGRGDSNAVFVFKFAGAFSIEAQSKVIFTNGTQHQNVIWLGGAGVTTGAISLGANSYMKGTMFSHNGAVIAGAGSNVEGRMFSTAGAIGFSTGVLYENPLYFDAASAPLPIELLSFTAKDKELYLQLDWVTSSEINNDYFNVECSSDGINFTSISKISGAGNSNLPLNYSVVYTPLLDGVLYYRLKQTDYNGKTSYSDIEAVAFYKRNDFTLDIYPNPFSVQTTFHTSKNLTRATLTVYNSERIVKQIKNISGQTFTFQRDNLSSGLYFINLSQDGKIIASDKLLITDY